MNYITDAGCSVADIVAALQKVLKMWHPVQVVCWST